jgi:hypothetical protein
MISALAGCAKSTTLEMSAPQVKVPALALAFNRKIASELGDRLPGNFVTKTMNGLGHGAWLRALQAGTRLELDDRKLGKLVTEIAKRRRVELSGDQWDGLRQLASKAMQLGIVPAECSENGTYPGLLPDTDENWLAAADDIGMLRDDAELLWELAREIVVEDISLARRGVISFDDQVYCPTLLGGRFPQFPVVFVDEAQDLSPLNHEMLRQSTRPDGRLVAVGDEKQAIYAFRGASGDSMQRIRGLRPQWQNLPLATTFRCPKVVVDRQREHAPGFRAWHTNADGRFVRLPAKFERASLDDGPPAEWSFADLQGLLPQARASLAVLCRNNAPLMSLAFKLLRQSVGVVMLGRDIGKGLAALSKKLAPQDAAPADSVRQIVREWITNEASRESANGHPERCASIQDRGECLLAVLDSAEVRDAGRLRLALAKLFARESGLVTLSSIHRAKGLEWDCVMLLDPWRIPSKWARSAGGVALQQELNLRYVAETRTKHTLVWANLESFH